jgi:hypothetical protein
MAAQTCRGLAPYAAGPVQVTGEGSLTLESNAVAAGLGYSFPRGFFADASVGTRSSATFNGSTLELAGGVGYEVHLGRYQLCPIAAAGMGTGPSKPFGNGESRSNRTAQLGLSAGISAGTIARWQVVPTLAFSYAYRQDAAHDYAGSTLFQISDHYALAQAGIAYVEGKVRRVVVEKDCVRRVVLDDKRALEADIVFSLYGSNPRTDLLRDLPVALERNGHIRIDDKNRTSLPGFFAAGDCDSKHSHQVVTAAHEGAMAAQAANHVLYPAMQRL